MRSGMFILIFAAFLASPFLLNTSTYSQEKEKVENIKVSMDGKGEDKNVKSDKPVNDPKKYGQEKDKTRSSTTTVVVDNYTAWYVKVYCDGYYQGMVAPYGKSYFSDFGDIMKLYAKADFDDGTYYYWGPRYINNDDYYTYTFTLQY